MGSTVYGRRYLRRMERALGEQLVHAVDNLVTTVDHRHFAWDGQEWHPVEPADGLCGLEGRYASCGLLFGTAGYLRGLMRGPCHECGAGPGALHRWNCRRLAAAMGMVPPDYWPRPVHRPMWMDDTRRRVKTHTKAMAELAIRMDTPFEAVFMRSRKMPPVNVELA